MNSSQIHLALTHVPVILSFVGLVLLAIALIRKNDILTKTAFYMLLAAGLFALPVYFTGEGAEEMVEEVPGVSEAIISRHEEFANIALAVIGIGGLTALAGLFVNSKRQVFRVVRLVTFFIALASAAAMAQTAHLGGQIRHSEIRPGFTGQTSEGNEPLDPAANNPGGGTEDNDDD